MVLRLRRNVFKSIPIMQYHWTLDTASSSSVDALYALAQSRLPAALEVKFAEFAGAIIDTHGKDLTVSTEPSRSATPVGPTAASTSATNSAAPSTTTPSVPAKPVKAEGKLSLSKAPIEVQADFMAAASDLFKTFTDENAIRRWAGSDAQVCLYLFALLGLR
jgi:activator of HSP90 ATPase